MISILPVLRNRTATYREAILSMEETMRVMTGDANGKKLPRVDRTPGGRGGGSG